MEPRRSERRTERRSAHTTAQTTRSWHAAKLGGIVSAVLGDSRIQTLLIWKLSWAKLSWAKLSWAKLSWATPRATSSWVSRCPCEAATQTIPCCSTGRRHHDPTHGTSGGSGCQWRCPTGGPSTLALQTSGWSGHQRRAGAEQSSRRGLSARGSQHTELRAVW